MERRNEENREKASKAKGFLIVAASLGVLWGIAFLKGRADK